MAASKTVCGGVISVHHGSGRGWRCVGRAMPFWCVCGAGSERACTAGNASHALSGLGDMVMVEWQGAGASRGGAGASASHGMECRGAGE
jgi:hypothetical protein